LHGWSGMWSGYLANALGLSLLAHRMLHPTFVVAYTKSSK
jgi:hypothetical protein